MLLSVVVLALLASVQGRAVNISNTWVLPEEGFPVFYRYFRDRISWYEADAVCQFHHANLVTVDTTAQYDAVRAYLKELDISSAVWVGLIRSNPDGDFTWTDYRGLSSDGYWSSAPDARTAPLCAAADPVADYRWEARACGGPTVASFICELPVPQWALGNEGCMVRALPALTILYLPESAAVQLTADCGMAGVKKVQCTGNVKREDLLKELSCADEEELSSTTSSVSTGSNWSASTDYTFTDQDTTNEVTTEETLTTEHETENNQSHVATATSLPRFIYTQTQYKTKVYNADKFNNVLFSKSVNLGENQDNNEHSNFIPKIEDEDNVLTNDQLEKLEDERHMKHKMFHEEIARVGNVENIFTQPTDHFIPPLVMAKAKLSDDMTVLSLAEKHAQQLAEKQFSKQNLNNVASDRLHSDNYGTLAKSSTENIDKPLIASVKPTKSKDYKKETLKSNLPKKYVNEKHYDVKNKVLKNIETKVTEADKTTEIFTTTEITTKYIETTTKNIYSGDNKKFNVDSDLGMDLTVMLKDESLTSHEQTSFAGDIAKLETIQNTTLLNYTKPIMPESDIAANKEVNFSSTPETTTVENVSMNHEIIKITILADNNTTSVFEMTSKQPIFRDSVLNSNVTTSPFGATHSAELLNTTANNKNLTITSKTIDTELTEPTTVPVTHFTSTIRSTAIVTQNVTTAQPVSTSTETTTSTEVITTTGAQNNVKKTEIAHEMLSTTSLPMTTVDLDSNTKLVSTTASNVSNEKLEEFNSTEYHEILLNMTDHRHTEEEDLPDSDFKSPLLSGEMEPMHRPPRTRRPQQPNRNNFNPFRILG